MPFLTTLLIQLIVGIATMAVGYLLTPRAKTDTDESVKDMDDPTAEGGRPFPVVFGERDVTSLNIVYFGDKATTSREIDA